MLADVLIGLVGHYVNEKDEASEKGQGGEIV